MQGGMGTQNGKDVSREIASGSAGSHMLSHDSAFYDLKSTATTLQYIFLCLLANQSCK